MIKNLPAIWETWVQSLGSEDSLEKGIGNPLRILGLETPIEEPGRLWSMVSQRDVTEVTEHTCTDGILTCTHFSTNVSTDLLNVFCQMTDYIVLEQ